MKLYYRNDNNSSLLSVDACLGGPDSDFWTEITEGEYEALGAVNALEAENAKLRAVLESLIFDAEYLAGRGFVGAIKREDAENRILMETKRARALLEEKL